MSYSPLDLFATDGARIDWKRTEENVNRFTQNNNERSASILRNLRHLARKYGTQTIVIKKNLKGA